MSAPAIILDCDPGHDDAVAIVTAAYHGDLIGITTVSGNVPLELTTRNALITSQIMELDVPVYSGAAGPLVGEPLHAEFIHGESGLAGPDLPELERVVSGNDAVRFIIDTVRTREDVWLVAVGPLTNVALALRSAPDIADRLAGISIMGGGIEFGNVTQAAEFNILADPEAAAAVFETPVRKLMAPLDLTHQFNIDDAVIDEIQSLPGRTATFVADMLDFYAGAYARAYSGRREGPLHDPCAVLAVTHPELFESEDLHVVVEVQGRHTRGMTLADRRAVRSELEPNTTVLKRIDVRSALQALREAIAAAP